MVGYRGNKVIVVDFPPNRGGQIFQISPPNDFVSPPNIPPKRLGGTDFFNIPPTLSDLGGTHFLFPATLVGEPLFADFPANLEGKSPDIPTKQGYFAGESRFLSKSPANRGCSHQTWIPQQKFCFGGDRPPKFCWEGVQFPPSNSPPTFLKSTRFAGDFF